MSDLAPLLRQPPLDPVATNDFYELVVERHRKASTAITSNRDPSEWLGLMADQLLVAVSYRPVHVGRL